MKGVNIEAAADLPLDACRALTLGWDRRLQRFLSSTLSPPPAELSVPRMSRFFKTHGIIDLEQIKNHTKET